MLENTFANEKERSSNQITNKTAWEVAIEYAALTFSSEKTIDKRTEEIAEYFDFYGYKVEDRETFREVIELFLKESLKAENAVIGMEEIEQKYDLTKKEKTFEEIKEYYKEPRNVTSAAKKPGRWSNKLFDRPVTLLLSASEKQIESLETIQPSQTLESQLERLSISEFSIANLETRRKTSRSLYLKRNAPEMTVGSSRPQHFSAAALKIIFSYLDYGFLKFTKPASIVVGDFVVLVIEIKSSELRKLSDCVALEMGDEELNIRILKPYPKFYSMAMSTVLKYGLKNLGTVDPEDFVDALAHLMKKIWRLDLKAPALVFYEWCKAEAGRDETLAFENIRGNMKRIWKAQIIRRSSKFKKVKLDHY